MTWRVGIEQTKPYEYINIEYFDEEQDALEFAQTLANGNGAVKLSKRRWRCTDDNKLIVWKLKQ